MESLLIIILVIIVIICAMIIFYATIYNKFQDYVIRINEVESIIDNCLRSKYDLINRAIPIVKSNIDKDEEIFGDIVKLRSRKIGNFELYRILKKASIELEGLKSTYPEIDKSDEIKKIIKEIKDIDAKVDNSTDYYNDNITITGLCKDFSYFHNYTHFMHNMQVYFYFYTYLPSFYDIH